MAASPFFKKKKKKTRTASLSSNNQLAHLHFNGKKKFNNLKNPYFKVKAQLYEIEI